MRCRSSSIWRVALVPAFGLVGVVTADMQVSWRWAARRVVGAGALGTLKSFARATMRRRGSAVAPHCNSIQQSRENVSFVISSCRCEQLEHSRRELRRYRLRYAEAR